MEQIVETLKQNEQQTRIEQEMIIENLNKEIESLRKRQEQTLNEQKNLLKDMSFQKICCAACFARPDLEISFVFFSPPKGRGCSNKSHRGKIWHRCHC